MIVMEKEDKYRITLLRFVEDKLRQLLPDCGDRVFIKEDNDSIVSKVSHSLPNNGKGDSFICQTADGEINLKDLKTPVLRYLDDKLKCKKYTFLEPPVVKNKLRPNITEDEYKQTVREAKQAFHDRIVNPTAYSFTPEQINALKRYRTMFTDDSSTLDLFIELSVSTYRDPDVIRKPEKWRENAFKDLMTLGEKILLDIHNNAEYHVKFDVEQAVAAAKQAIRERIINSWQRFFTSDQAFDLRNYAGLFPDVIPSELFRHLYEDVIKEPEVTRKPEKWQTDTLKELNDLAEGITRDQTRGMRI